MCKKWLIGEKTKPVLAPLELVHICLIKKSALILCLWHFHLLMSSLFMPWWTHPFCSIGYLWDVCSCNKSALKMTAVHAFLQPVLRQTAVNRLQLTSIRHRQTDRKRTDTHTRTHRATRRIRLVLAPKPFALISTWAPCPPKQRWKRKKDQWCLVGAKSTLQSAALHLYASAYTPRHQHTTPE